jgi:hypothetical protein
LAKIQGKLVNCRNNNNNNNNNIILGTVLKLHLGLQKAESSVLVQARTGRIGLAKFLYNRKVPGIQSAQCQSGAEEETPRHMALYCIEEAGRRPGLRTNGVAMLSVRFVYSPWIVLKKKGGHKASTYRQIEQYPDPTRWSHCSGRIRPTTYSRSFYQYNDQLPI